MAPSVSLTEDLHQKKMSTWVTAVSRARLRRQPMPIRGLADSRQTTLSTVVASSDGSSPFSLKQDTGYKHTVSPTPSSSKDTEGGLHCSQISLLSWLCSCLQFPTLAT